MSSLEFKVHLGVNGAAQSGLNASCANDNQGRDQDNFERSIERELVVDTD